MADKLTQQITDALTRAAAEPGGLPLYAGKAESGLFSTNSTAKLAAQKCLTDGFVHVVGTDAKGKTPRELFGLTEKGWEFLLAQVNPRQVLEDFVRVLEERRGEVGELLDVARRMADSLQGLKDAVTRVLPVVSAGRIPLRNGPHPEDRPHPPTPSPRGRGGFELPLSPGERGLGGEGGLRERGLGGAGVSGSGDAVAVLDVPPVAVAADLAPMILAQLADWSGNAGEDCPLPRLFRSISVSETPTIGEFHDCLRRLEAEGAIYLHPWTAPLYAMPEPAYALLTGHNVSYYASLKKR